MRTTVQLGLALCVGLVACRPGDVAGTDAAPIMLAPGDPVWGLTGAQRNLFGRGRLVFRREFTPETGLGPLLNSTSCAECRSEEHTSELQSQSNLVCRLLLEKKKNKNK